MVDQAQMEGHRSHHHTDLAAEHRNPDLEEDKESRLAGHSLVAVVVRHSHVEEVVHHNLAGEEDLGCNQADRKAAEGADIDLLGEGMENLSCQQHDHGDRRIFIEKTYETVGSHPEAEDLDCSRTCRL